MKQFVRSGLVAGMATGSSEEFAVTRKPGSDNIMACTVASPLLLLMAGITTGGSEEFTVIPEPGSDDIIVCTVASLLLLPIKRTGAASLTRVGGV